MKSGKCPKCGSSEIMTDDGRLHTGWVFDKRVKIYQCESCGFMEFYNKEYER